jgi:hypothetical protein
MPYTLVKRAPKNDSSRNADEQTPTTKRRDLMTPTPVILFRNENDMFLCCAVSQQASFLI